MTPAALPQTAVREDRRLEKAADSTTTALMDHRWHWTLDESNPKRVGFTAYARATGKSEPVIRAYAKGRVLMSTNPGMTVGDAMERSKMSVETELATEAVAKAQGIEFQTASKTRRNEIARVREWAREDVEEKGSDYGNTVKKIAKTVANSQGAAATRASRQKKRGLQYLKLEGKLAKMRRIGVEALTEAQNLEFDDDEVVQDLTSLVKNIRAALELLDMKISGSASVDWDAELAKLDEGR